MSAAMSNAKRTADSKRTTPPRNVKKSNDFLKDWKKLSRSGKQDLNGVKEAMMLLIANDAPLPPEWKDHPLKGLPGKIRECHAKGDLLITYYIEEDGEDSLITFLRAGTHSEIFGR